MLECICLKISSRSQVDLKLFICVKKYEVYEYMSCETVSFERVSIEIIGTVSVIFVV
jgi:hypothetical protein